MAWAHSLKAKMERIEAEHQLKLQRTEQRTEAMAAQIAQMEQERAASEKDDLEAAAEAVHHKLLELGATPDSQSQSESARSEEQKERPLATAAQKAKILALQRSTHGFKQAVEGLKQGMTARWPSSR